MENSAICNSLPFSCVDIWFESRLQSLLLLMMKTWQISIGAFRTLNSISSLQNVLKIEKKFNFFHQRTNLLRAVTASLLSLSERKRERILLFHNGTSALYIKCTHHKWVDLCIALVDKIQKLNKFIWMFRFYLFVRKHHRKANGHKRDSKRSGE